MFSHGFRKMQENSKERPQCPAARPVRAVHANQEKWAKRGTDGSSQKSSSRVMPVRMPPDRPTIILRSLGSLDTLRAPHAIASISISISI